MPLRLAEGILHARLEVYKKIEEKPPLGGEGRKEV